MTEAMSNLTWKFVPAEDCTVDSEHQLLADGKETGFTIQDCRGYAGSYGVNEHGGTGRDYWMAIRGNFKTLKAAKEFAEQLYTERTKDPIAAGEREMTYRPGRFARDTDVEEG
jgi:hypothetical protein